MPDLNKLMSELEEGSSDIKLRLTNLLQKYEDLYREGNRQFRTERTASSGSMEGLEEFRRLILIVKRNKDVVGSLMRGIGNLRSMSSFKFIEEEVPVKKIKKTKSSPKIEKVEMPVPITAEES